MIRVILFCTISFLFFSSESLPQRHIIFNHLTIEDGLSQSSVTCILQDRNGFMWFGTQDGLNRYDGYNIKIFKNDPVSLSTVRRILSEKGLGNAAFKVRHRWRILAGAVPRFIKVERPRPRWLTSSGEGHSKWERYHAPQMSLFVSDLIERIQPQFIILRHRKGERVFAAMDCGVQPRNTFFQCSVRCQIQIRDLRTVSIRASKDHLFCRLQDDGFRRIPDVNDNRSILPESCGAPSCLRSNIGRWLLQLPVATRPGRFYGFAFVHAAADKGRIDSMVRTFVERHGFRGIKAHRHDARISREVCETARALAIPVLYDPMGEVETVELLAREYPDVNFIIPHLSSFAGDWPAQLAFVDHLTRHPNVYTDTSGVRDFDLLAEAVRRAGAEKVLFGSDGPWLHPGLELAKIKALCLPPEAERRSWAATCCGSSVRDTLSVPVRPPHL